MATTSLVILPHQIQCECSAIVSKRSICRHKREHCKLRNTSENNNLNNIQMPAKKKTSKKLDPQQVIKGVSLQQALDGIAKLPNPPNTQKIWKNAIITLVYYLSRPNEDDAYLTNEELAQKYKEVNVFPLFEDYDKMLSLIESNTILNKKTQAPVGLESKKQYWYAILSIIGKNGTIQLPDETIKKYTAKKEEYDKLSHHGRKDLQPKEGVVLYPEFTYPVMTKQYNDFLDSNAMTNTGKGRKTLRNACVVGLYILQRPRRIEDYCSLQLYTKLPNEEKMKGKNILLWEKVNDDDNKKVDKMTFYIDVFKTRFITSKKGKKNEVLPRYIKTLNPKLTSLLVDYIKKWGIADMSKVHDNKEYYVFYKETGNPTDAYDASGFSKYVSSCLKQVFNKSKLNVGFIRHVFSDWIWNNLRFYDEHKLDEIAIDVGDKQFITQMRYRHVSPELRDIAVTEINEGLQQRHEHDMHFLENAYQINENDDIDSEINSPQNRNILQPTQTDALYVRLGKALMEVEKIKAEILKGGY